MLSFLTVGPFYFMVDHPSYFQKLDLVLGLKLKNDPLSKPLFWAYRLLVTKSML